MLGGVCLNVGCIPSKALLHAAKVIEDAQRDGGARDRVRRADDRCTDKLRDWKNKVVGRLTTGLAGLAKQRKVTVLRGVATFADAHTISRSTRGRAATASPCRSPTASSRPGSESLRLPGLPDDPRIIDSTGALELDLPRRMLVVGGGIIGLEMATVYAALGVKVSVVELTEGLMPGCDRDLVRPLEKRIAAQYEAIMLRTKVTGIEALRRGTPRHVRGREGARAAAVRQGAGRRGAHAERRQAALRGGRRARQRARLHSRRPAAAHQRAAHLRDRRRRRPADARAQGDARRRRSPPKSLPATSASSTRGRFPSVAYTDPEIAWAGVTETDAKAQGHRVREGGVSRGPRAVARWPTAATRASPSCCSIRRRTA